MIRKNLLLTLLMALVVPLAAWAQSAPRYMENFNSYVIPVHQTDPIIPDDWSVQNPSNNCIATVLPPFPSEGIISKCFAMGNVERLNSNGGISATLPTYTPGYSCARMTFKVRSSSNDMGENTLMVRCSYIRQPQTQTQIITLYTCTPSTSWQDVEIPLTVIPNNAKNIKISFVYVGRSGAPARTYYYIDDVVIEKDLRAPTNLTLSDTNEQGATLSWTSEGLATQWIVEYGTDPGFASGTYTQTTVSGTPSLTITGLSTFVDYYIRVCASENTQYLGPWSTTIAYTPLSLYSISITGGNSILSMACPTRTNSNYSTTQQIYTSGELNNTPCIIRSIDFYTPTLTITRNLDIYMVHTDMWAFDIGYDWVEVTDADLVFSGDVTFAKDAWTTILLQNGFEYNGYSNVVLVVDDNTGSSEDICSFAATTTLNNASLVAAYNDYNPNPVGSSGALYGTNAKHKNQIRLGCGTFCPTDLTFDATMAELSWTDNSVAPQWVLQYGTSSSFANGTYTELNCTSTTANLTGLTPNTPYFARVKSVYSGWSETLTFELGTKIIIGYEDPNDDSDWDNKVPTNVSFNYSLTQQIYTAQDLGETAQIIQSIDFYCKTDDDITRYLDIYMVRTDKDEFEDYYDFVREWERVSNADLVFSGEVTFAPNDWTTIVFDTPFTYNGVQNIILVVDDNTGSSTDAYCEFSVSSKDYMWGPRQVLSIYSTNENYDPQAVLEREPDHVSDYKNSVRFGISTFPAPTSLSVTYNPNDNTEAFLSWTENGTATQWVIQIGTDPSFSEGSYNEGNVTDGPPYTELTGLTPDTPYYVRLKSDYGSDGYSPWSQTITVETTTKLIIGDGSVMHEALPTNVAYNYSYSQQIYTVDELQHTSCLIESIDFSYSSNCTRYLNIYMVSTSLTDAWAESIYHPTVDVTDADLVFRGNVTFTRDEWTTITLNTPFEYNGMSNVALVVIDNSGRLPQGSFRAFNSENQSFMHYNNTTGYTANFHQSYYGGDGYAYCKNQVRLGRSLHSCAAPSGLTATSTISFEATTATLSWTENGSATQWVLQYGTDPEYNEGNYTELNCTSTSANLTGLTAETTYYARVKAVCSADDYSIWDRTTFTPTSKLLITGDDPKFSSGIPTYVAKNFSLTQQIYTHDELLNTPCLIESIDFLNSYAGGECTRNLDIYMVHTDKEKFNDRNDWIRVTDDDLMFSGEVTFPNINCWTTIMLDKGFEYDGMSNVVLVVDDNTGSANSTKSFRVFYTGGVSGYKCLQLDSDADINPFGSLGEAYHSTLRNEIKLGRSAADFCMRPVGLTVSLDPVNATTATLSWTENGEATQWVLQYGTDPSFANGSYTQRNVTGTPSVSLTGLTPETTYYARVKSVCGADSHSFWISNEFFPTATIVIGSGTEADDRVPLKETFSITQQIYTHAELLDTPYLIESIDIFNNSSDLIQTLDIYMVHTDKEAFNDKNDWVAVTAADLVFSGEINFAKNSWTTITLQSGFEYNGMSNVVLVVDNNGAATSDKAFRVFDSGLNQALHLSGNLVNYDPTGSLVVANDIMTTKNQIRLRWSAPNSCTKPTCLSVVANPTDATKATLRWTENSSATQWVLQYGTDADFAEGSYTEQNCSTTTVNLTDLTLETIYYARVKSVCGASSHSAWSAYATFIPTTKLVIGDGHATSGLYPTRVTEYTDKTQQIYTHDELMNRPCLIESIDFYNILSSTTRTLDIYLVHTDKEAFDSNNDEVAVTPYDLVFSGKVSFSRNTWKTIVLDSGFEYDGVSNVVLVVHDNSNTGLSYVKHFLVFDSGLNQAIGNGLTSMKNQIRLGWSEPNSCRKPNLVATFDPLLDNTVATVDWRENGEATQWVLQYGTDADFAEGSYTEQNCTTTTVNLTGLTPETTYYARVKSVCDTESHSLWSNTATISMVTDAVIGNGNSGSRNLPTATSSRYSLSQQIYTAEELQREACLIESISFYVKSGVYPNRLTTRNLDIYMIPCGRREVFPSNTAWVPGMQDPRFLVFSGEVTFDRIGWITIALDQPFEYDGLQNVVLAVDDNTGSFNDIINFGASSSTSYQALYKTSYDDIKVTSPGQGARSYNKNQIRLGRSYRVSSPANLAVAANPEDDTMVTLSWTQSGEASQWVVQYGTDPDFAEGSYAELNSTMTSAQLTGLTPDIFYYARVKTLWNGHQSGWSSKRQFMATSTNVIGSGTGKDAFLPMDAFDAFSFTQQIYTKDELPFEACTVESIAFYCLSEETVRNLDIYMVHTDKVKFTSTSNWVNVTANDLVFSGEVTFAQNAWTPIMLQSGFEYDGQSNIVLAVDDNTGSWENGARYFLTFTGGQNQSLVRRDLEQDIQPLGTIGAASMLTKTKNQIRLGRGASNPCVKPSLSVALNPSKATVATLSWTENGTATEWVLQYGTDFTEGNYTELSCTTTSVILTGLTPETTYKARVKAVCSNTDHSTWSNPVTFMPSRKLVIGSNGTTTKNAIPTSTYHKYSLSQQIYTHDELQNKACTIESIDFHSHGQLRVRNLDIYMVHTDKEAFSSTSDWVTVTSDDLVFSGEVTFPKKSAWTSIVLDNGFEYDGVSNVVLVVDDNTGSPSEDYSRFLVFNSESTQTIYRTWTTNAGLDPLGTPSAGYTSMFKNLIRLGRTITVNPPSDLAVTLSHISATMATLSWTDNASATEWTVQYGTDPDFAEGTCTELTVTGTPSALLTGLVLDTTCYARVNAVWNGHISEWSDSVSFIPSKKVVIEGSTMATNPNIPTFTNRNFSLTQQIYTHDELQDVACSFGSIEFYTMSGQGCTRTINIYLLHTEKEKFNSTSDWIGVTTDDLVFSGEVTFVAEGWSTITFDKDFEYDGVNNVVLVVDDNTGSTSGQHLFGTFQTTKTQALFHQHNSNNYDPLGTPGVASNYSQRKNVIRLGRSYLKMFVIEGNWSEASNWQDGIMPTDSDAAVIAANCYLDQDATVGELSFVGGNTLFVQSGYTLNATSIDSIGESRSTLFIKDSGQVKSANPFYGIIEKDITGYGAENVNQSTGWNLIAPLESGGAVGMGFVPMNGEEYVIEQMDLYGFNQTADLEWVNKKNAYYNNGNDVRYLIVNPKEGYLYARQDDGTLNFKAIGGPNIFRATTDDVEYDELVYDADAAFAGWNLIGNPYTANAYVKDAEGNAMAYYRMNAAGDRIVLAEAGTPIKPCEGVFVQVTDNGSVWFTTTAPQSGRGAMDFTVSKHSSTRDGASASATPIDRARISFNEGNGMGHLDLMADANRLYIPQSGKDMAVVCSEPVGEMPLNFEAAENGTYTLGISLNDTELVYCHLIDNMTGADVDLLATSTGSVAEYTFEAKTTDYRSRFKVVFAAKSAFEGDNANNFAFHNGSAWVVNASADATVQVIDMTGRVVLSTDVARNVSTKGMAPGVYVMRLIDGNDVKTQKIVVD